MIESRSPAPAHLSERCKTLWRGMVRHYELDAAGLELLMLALEALDRCEQARETLATDGVYLKDRFGQLRAHPAVAVERDSRIAAARLFRELDLEGDPLPAPTRRR
jgi:hypothetical protein